MYVFDCLFHFTIEHVSRLPPGTRVTISGAEDLTDVTAARGKHYSANLLLSGRIKDESYYRIFVVAMS